MRQGDETYMTVRGAIRKAGQLEELNFLLTNRIPRRLATRFMGWFSRIEAARRCARRRWLCGASSATST